MSPQTLSLFPEAVDNKKIDFLFVINPSDSVSSDAKEFKKEFYQIFGFFPSRGSKPHITIADIECRPKNQEKIISELKNNHPQIGPFNVLVNGFADYEGNGNRVLHLYVEKSDEFKRLEKYYKRMKKILERYKKRYYVSENPHITIARNLSFELFESAKKEFLSRSYQTTFTAKRITILRREIVDGIASRYEIFDEITL